MRGGARLVCSTVLLLASPGVASAVIGGTPADPAEWSFVVAILDASTAEPLAAQFCAGSLVAPDRVLTAAHCVDGRDASSVQVAPVGTSLSAIAPGDRIAVDRIDVYPLHRPGRAFADVALLHLTRPLATTADLPLGLFYGDGVKLARFAGWGLTDPAGGRHPDALLTAAATILSRTGCASSSIEPGTLCATFPGSGESAVCPGDSGGPLADLVSGRRPRLIGIVSFVPLSGGTGPLCGVGKTTVYTSVGRFRSWIVHVLRNRDPATSMPEVTRVRARDLGRVIDVRADWCQTAATGHRMRVDITLWRSRRPISTILRARSTAPCSQAVVRRTGLSPGRYVVSVKIKDQTTAMVTPTPELLRGTLTVVR